jgi:hypothetical protein
MDFGKSRMKVRHGATGRVCATVGPRDSYWQENAITALPVPPLSTRYIAENCARLLAAVTEQVCGFPLT